MKKPAAETRNILEKKWPDQSSTKGGGEAKDLSLPRLTIFNRVQSSWTGLEVDSRQKWQGGSGVTSSLKCSTPSRKGCSMMSGGALSLSTTEGAPPSLHSQSGSCLRLFRGRDEHELVLRRSKLLGREFILKFPLILLTKSEWSTLAEAAICVVIVSLSKLCKENTG